METGTLMSCGSALWKNAMMGGVLESNEGKLLIQQRPLRNYQHKRTKRDKAMCSEQGNL